MRPQALQVRLIALCFLAIALSASAYGQSGRRQPSAPPSAPVPTPTPEPEPSPTPKPDTKADFGFLIGLDRAVIWSTTLQSYDGVVANACADRLRTNSGGYVDVAGRDMNRGEASKRAKEDKTTYVVLLSIPNGDATMGSNNQELVVEFVVFAPETGKIATSGRSYPNSARKGPLIVGPSGTGTNSTIYLQELMRRAGEDVADRILKSLHLNSPGPSRRP